MSLEPLPWLHPESNPSGLQLQEANCGMCDGNPPSSHCRPNVSTARSTSFGWELDRRNSFASVAKSSCHQLTPGCQTVSFKILDSVRNLFKLPLASDARRRLF